MSTSFGIPAASAAAPAVGAQQSSATGLGALDSEAFLKLLVAQLRYQNPMEPTDPSAMLQQTSQFTQVETLQQLAKSQAQLAGLQQASMAADLVGKQVTARNPDGKEISGVVDAVRFTELGPVLVVGSENVPLSAASELRGATPTSSTT